MDNKTKAVEMLKALAKSVDGTTTEERINEVIALLEETGEAHEHCPDNCDIYSCKDMWR